MPSAGAVGGVAGGSFGAVGGALVAKRGAMVSGGLRAFLDSILVAIALVLIPVGLLVGLGLILTGS